MYSEEVRTPVRQDQQGFIDTARRSWTQYWERPAPYTAGLMGVMTVVFVLEVSGTIIFDAPSILALVAYLYLNVPWLMWVLAPVVHGSAIHFASNIGMLALLRPVEAHLSKRAYVYLFLVAGYLSIFGGAAYILTFGEKPPAVYGTSGFIFGLVGFALLYLFFSVDDRQDIDSLVLKLSIAGPITVALDIPGALNSPLTFNAAHLFGLVIGMIGWGVYRVVDGDDLNR